MWKVISILRIERDKKYKNILIEKKVSIIENIANVTLKAQRIKDVKYALYFNTKYDLLYILIISIDIKILPYYCPK